MNRLIHGDCLEEMKGIESGSVDMVLTDPPYGTTACKWDAIIPLEPMWEQLKRIIKPNGAIVMTASQPFTTILIASNMKMFRYEWIWDKLRGNNPLLAKKQPMKCHENVIVFYIRQPTYNPQMTEGKPYRLSNTGMKNVKINTAVNKNGWEQTTDTSKRFPLSVQRFKIKTSGKFHTAEKPVALMEYLIKTYTNKEETVLDFTMGSGTTGVACKNLNRNFIGIEKDEGYYKIACERIEGIR